MDENRYIIIGRSSCPFCTMAIDFCVASEEQYIFLDYENNQDILEDYKVFYKQKTVPIILSNNLNSGLTKKIGGYTDLLDSMKEQ